MYNALPIVLVYQQFLLHFLKLCSTPWFCKINSWKSKLSSTIMLRPLVLFLPPGNHLPISFAVFLYFFSLQICNLIFFYNLLPSILCICSLQFILYCINLSLYKKMLNCSLMSVLLFLSQSVYPAIGLKNLISAASIFLLSDRFRDQFSLPYIRTGTAITL